MSAVSEKKNMAFCDSKISKISISNRFISDSQTSVYLRKSKYPCAGWFKGLEWITHRDCYRSHAASELLPTDKVVDTSSMVHVQNISVPSYM